MNKQKICYILAYYSPQYIRTRTLITALKQIPTIKLFEARNNIIGFGQYIQTLSKLFFIRLRYNPDCYILGFRGYEIFWLVRLITIGKPLVIDHMMSPYDSLLYESKKVKPNTILDRLIYRYEQSTLRSAHLILTDTVIHQKYFSNLFNVPLSKIKPVSVGTDETVFKPFLSNKIVDNTLKLLFYGSFLPLHGIDIILQAAKLVEDLPIEFTLIGGNRIDLTEFHAVIKQLGLTNIIHSEWIDFEQLPNLINQTDIGLGGPFGNTGQGRRVITGKTFQFLAMSKAVIVGKIDHDYGFVDKDNCLLIPQGNAQVLAQSIEWAYKHRSHLIDIGFAGWELYQKQFSVTILKNQLTTILS